MVILVSNINLIYIKHARSWRLSIGIWTFFFTVMDILSFSVIIPPSWSQYIFMFANKLKGKAEYNKNKNQQKLTY